MLSLITLLLSTYVNIIHSGYSCNEINECDSIDTHAESVSCGGYYGCGKNEIIAGEYVSCTGYLGCALNTYIKAYDSNVGCYGYKGCVGTEHIWSEEGHVYCYGVMGCYDVGEIKALSGWIFCRGYVACSKVDSFISPSIECSGDQACKSSTITTVAGEDNRLLATGKRSMSGAVYECVEGSTSCSVQCEGSGCYDFTIIYPNKKSDITLTPNSCKKEENQGQDIASEGIVMICPTLVSAADYKASGATIKRKSDDSDNDIDMELFEEVLVDSETFLSSHQSMMNVKEILLSGLLVVNGILLTGCVYQRYKKKEYLPL